MADIVTRLLLKTNDFDANLSKSKKSVDEFQGGITNMAKTAAAGIAKFAGGIGLAMGATEAFTRVMGSQQSTQDEWDNNMFAAKMTVDKFFTSINNGDWRPFHDGLIESLKRAKGLSEQIDALNDKRLSLTYIKSEALANIEGNRATATDTTEPLAVRRKAFADMQKERIELEKKTNETIKAETSVLVNTLKESYGDLNWEQKDLMDFVVKTNFDGGTAEFAAYKAELEELKKLEVVTTNISGGMHGGGVVQTVNKEAAARTAEFRKQNEYLEKQRILEQEIDSKRIKSVETLRNQAIERRELETLAKSENRIQKQLISADKKEDDPLAGSLAFFDAELSKANKKLTEATGAQARAAIQATIDELEKKKIELLVVEKGDSLDALSLRISKLKTEFATATTDEARKEIYKLIKELESKQLKINLTAKYDENKASLKNAGLPTTGLDTSKIKLPKHESLIGKKDIDLSNEYNESLYAMGSMLGSLSTAFDGNTGSVLQWGASLLGTIAQAIPAIIGMTAVKATDTVATNANTTAEVTNAGAKALSAHAGIPFVGIALGLAGVAAIAAAIASMPKFESGGIVGGNSFTGDSIIARVNSGEMILNQSQQANLFSMLNTRRERPTLGNMAQIVQPTEQKEVQISGSFKVKGSDLELALKNQTNKKSKIR